MQKKYTPMIIAAILFFTFGLMTLLQGIEDKGKGVQVTATIEDIQLRTGSSSDDGSDTHDVYVNYTYGDKDYERVSYRYYMGSMHVGDKMKIMVDKKDPSKIYYSSEYMMIGYICVPVSIMMMIMVIIDKRKSRMVDL